MSVKVDTQGDLWISPYGKAYEKNAGFQRDQARRHRGHDRRPCGLVAVSLYLFYFFKSFFLYFLYLFKNLPESGF